VPLTDTKIGWVYVCRMADSVERLYDQVIAAKDSDPGASRTAKLLQSGRHKVTKKVAEEAIEVVIETMSGGREAVVRESSDLLYNLVVLWVAAGVRPQDVWDEMARRERLFGLAEKVPKRFAEQSSRRKVVLLESRRRKRR
jgi:phosphoribosyl-ATP pyrophosphohydrolase